MLASEVPKHLAPQREDFLSGGAPGEYQYQKRIEKQSVNAVPLWRGSVQDKGAVPVREQRIARNLWNSLLDREPFVLRLYGLADRAHGDNGFFFTPNLGETQDKVVRI